MGQEPSQIREEIEATRIRMGDTVEALVIASNNGFHPDEVGVNMHGRTGGAPSNRRFRLFYYYVRLVVVLLSSARRRSTRDASREARR